MDDTLHGASICHRWLNSKLCSTDFVLYREMHIFDYCNIAALGKYVVEIRFGVHIIYYRATGNVVVSDSIAKCLVILLVTCMNGLT
jgi:hypothetical protein